MSDDTYLRAHELFRAALERTETERESFIAVAAGIDPEIAAAAAKMLRDYQDTKDPEPGSAIVLPEWAGDREESVVHGWRVDRHLGFGGSGSVYRAWRPAPGGEEEAAIKFLDMAPGEVERFGRERQILADLNHRGICKFIDGGTTDAGVPYMVMEYVSGRPITQYCDHLRLTVTERLKLFVELCQAVEYAHQQGVMHRDLKPSNIFVTAVGAVRVLDFGIAKLVSFGRGTLLTKPGEARWTKAYASPEQVRGAHLSFATDVYALGVLLYELVTGQLPFSEFALDGPDWMRVVYEREPLPPSQALLLQETGPRPYTMARPPESASNLRDTSPSWLQRVLAGNLDAIILKTLKKDPQQRYQRVDRLRVDIEHFLEGMPVTARRSSPWERAWNWSSRHPFTAVLTLVSTLWIFFLLQLGMLKDIRYGAELRAQENAARRLRYLAEAGLPSIEKAMHSDLDVRDSRVLAAQIHTRLLQRMEAIPAYSLTSLDSTLAASALRCGGLWNELGGPRTALAVTAPVLPRVAKRYELDRRDRRWRELYTDILRQRIEIYTRLQRTTEAADLGQRLAEVEARRH